ncbi:flagellar biosynthesis protein FlhB [Metabacillus sediminilitoris]|uniref:Flagellar biosynthetic protein FlhB n=1 Tax=Metabacillus sediminilitoris TaxID=2567941 RepID=A0A4S4C593_9BACI|nr:flagellar biosynthesis protein FlhB [Metabacillus sediminilitoris]QGQ46841.1 flagellar biosynthesis protein FlhB [Metabacillus sediminilitoris]THF82989.1 flagellar biosynthesis protein FlhB [Metabacillus sediminilitoris]
MNLLKLDLQFFSGEKTEKATPRKKQDARKKGQVIKSADVNTALSLLTVFLSFLFIGAFMRDRLILMMKGIFQDYLLVNLTDQNMEGFFYTIALQAGMILAPIMVIALIAGVLSNYIQVGFLFSTESIQMKLNKLDPIQGFKRIYSMRAIVELLKSLLKITVVGVVTFAVLWMDIDNILRLSQMTVEQSFVFIASLTMKMGLYASGALLILSFLDYLYQRFDYEKNLRMSKQDIKDEYKKSEGDPLIKSKIRQRQREMAMRRMMQDVPTADVVITNPTHYAIALKYDEEKMDAPYVVAMGVDHVAQKIKEIAKANDIIMVENRPLARALYDQVDLGQAVPEEFFQAVAEIIAYVYQTKSM